MFYQNIDMPIPLNMVYHFFHYNVNGCRLYALQSLTYFLWPFKERPTTWLVFINIAYVFRKMCILSFLKILFSLYPLQEILIMLFKCISFFFFVALSFTKRGKLIFYNDSRVFIFSLRFCLLAHRRFWTCQPP